MVCEQLKKSGLASPKDGRWSRVVIEKPFGHDLQSAEDLNKVVSSVFPNSRCSASITIWAGDGAEHPGTAFRQ